MGNQQLTIAEVDFAFEKGADPSSPAVKFLKVPYEAAFEARQNHACLGSRLVPIAVAMRRFGTRGLLRWSCRKTFLAATQAPVITDLVA